MSKTFYISSSSHPDNLPAVKSLAAELKKLGYVWDFDWVTNVEKERAEPGSGLPSQDVIELDLMAAAHTDLFVFLDSSYQSRGGMMEYGVRLLTGTIMHIGVQDSGYLFFTSYRVKHHDSVERFLEYLRATH